ncbi:hypothetical protein BBP40_012451 [Aspergillus hancockii]|nr:hypothetical protein BBP40_012451 [Aspergillus hancockii]
MASELIFITGATGFIGSATALQALKSGYRLRISVRKESQILSLKEIFKEYTEKLQFVLVPNITEQSAFAGKLDGADYIIHLASPLPHGNDKTSYFGPAVDGTISILKEAATVKSIKRVVITSSIAALIPMTGIPDGGVIREDNNWDLTVDQSADLTASDPFSTALALYHASKLLANSASWDFKHERKPHFGLVTIHPAYVYGHNVAQTTADGIKGTTNGALFTTIMTGQIVGNITAVHVQDVAEAHLKALDAEVPDGSKYLLSGEKASWKDVVDILQTDYPGVPFKLGPDAVGNSWPVDTTRAETQLGIKWRSLSSMVHEVMDQQLAFQR